MTWGAIIRSSLLRRDLTLRYETACACMRNCCFCLFGQLEALYKHTRLFSRGQGQGTDMTPTACCHCGEPFCALAYGSTCTAQEATQAGPFCADKTSFCPVLPRQVQAQ